MALGFDSLYLFAEAKKSLTPFVCDNQILWKQKNCITFEKPPLEKEAVKKPKLPSSDAIREGNLGSEHLTTLWASGDTIDEKMRAKRRYIFIFSSACRTASRKIITLDEKLLELDEQVAEDCTTPLDGIEEEYLLYNEQNYNWLVYRIAMSHHMHLFRGEGPGADPKAPAKALLMEWRKDRAAAAAAATNPLHSASSTPAPEDESPLRVKEEYASIDVGSATDELSVRNESEPPLVEAAQGVDMKAEV
ncbi:hypothetical protein BDK51DRAFT_25835 [Blyttiomyces helicus]|uniref:Uncharacterized protein n=1 Tax=Blyttiomyces helicus TaxID=388810 RepID=A0A4P9VZ51_9FUNG|nr:hypothetical protein BDK51DRAFT_25835 [Blyttiomyces helicus]|eukprot:RKO85081.1 hypothetical protein BDK51DRAFT_25835 [Blyttiomyces helicus]